MVRFRPMLAATLWLGGCTLFAPETPQAPDGNVDVKNASAPAEVASLWAQAVKDENVYQIQALLATGYHLHQAGSGDGKDAEVARHTRFFASQKIRSAFALLGSIQQGGDTAQAECWYQVQAVGADSQTVNLAGRAQWTFLRDEDRTWKLLLWKDGRDTGTARTWASWAGLGE